MRTLLLFTFGTLYGQSAEYYDTIRKNDLGKLQSLVASGADVNSRDRRGSTPLMHAAGIGSLEAIRILVNAKAPINAANDFNSTALLWSASDPARVRILLEAGADVNVRSKQGRTPLLAAATAGSLESVRLLIAKGADAKAADGFGRSTLERAAASGNVELARLLLDAGVDVNAADKMGFTTLHAAIAAGSPDLVRLLIARGANVNAANAFAGKVKNGDIALVKLTPLMMAAPYGPIETVRDLVSAGADVNAKDGRGMTPLMFAVASEKQDAKIVSFLLSKGADTSIKAEDGATAADWAGKFRHPAVMRLFPGTKQPVDTTQAANPAPAADARTGAERGLALLQRSSTEFFKQSGCVGCHHQNLTAFAAAEARDRGVRVDEPAATAQLKLVQTQAAALQESLMQLLDPPGSIDTVMYGLLHLAAEKHPADSASDALAHYLASQQRPDGSWWAGGISRAPIEDGQIHRTALALRALQVYGPPGRIAEFNERIARARKWLESKAEPVTNDDRAMQILGVKWAGGSASRIEALSRRLIAEQRPDGGWSQNRYCASDAYATGQTLHALRISGVLRPADETYRRGVLYLLRTQREDGSWHVASRAPKFQPYFESGFPHGHDQWISASATAWAVMALAAAEPAKSVARR